jgi:hypothetical protein
VSGGEPKEIRSYGAAVSGAAVPEPPGETNPFEAMMQRFDHAAELLNLDEGIYRILRHPRSRS